MEEQQAQWYLKERIPCFIVQEIPSHEHVQIAALETMIDFTAGTSSSSMHWSINNYDSLMMTQEDLLLLNTLTTFNPGWTWSIPQSSIDSRMSKPMEGKKAVNYKPPPLISIIIAKDRIPWVKPPTQEQYFSLLH